LPSFNHAILFFGGLAGLEEHIDGDESINVKKPAELFQLYINSVIGQGCRTIRTEEAIPITLAALYRHVRLNQPPAAAE
jgi:predicted SPOUT superfamily RNA methylase MTH1